MEYSTFGCAFFILQPFSMVHLADYWPVCSLGSIMVYLTAGHGFSLLMELLPTSSAAFTMFFPPRTPASAKLLTEEERAGRLKRDGQEAVAVSEVA